MLIKLRFFLAILISLSILISCRLINNDENKLPEYVNKDWVKFESKTYSLFFPDSLSLDTNFLNLEFILRSKKVGDIDFMENLNLERQEINREKLLNLDKTISESIETYLNGQITESYFKEINGIKYKFDKCEARIDNKDYTFLIYNHLMDTTKYQLTVTMEKNASGDYAPLFDKIIGTMHFKK